MAQKSSAIEDLRTKTDDQLIEALTGLKREAYNLRFQAATNQLERPARVKEVRRQIARIQTLQGQRNGHVDDLDQTAAHQLLKRHSVQLHNTTALRSHCRRHHRKENPSHHSIEFLENEKKKNEIQILEIHIYKQN